MSPEFMLFFGMLSCYAQAARSYHLNNSHTTPLHAFGNLWRYRPTKTILAIAGGLVGFATIPLLEPFYPAAYTEVQRQGMTAILAFIAGYAGSLTIDKLVTVFHKKINNL